ncbi:hypothetical protein Prum_053040 [Phytohabitans rumicis]|uniref:Uncharacterized protein n=1 Tax=Phytohabitans rumicis TaxID=1076125 RepID=A0A6V8L307_9ACTN|nr:hypothetical protein Prum_053040 [Phytohabitans rumicis]
MRGGLDDALDRLARMDQLRRRAQSAAGGVPTAHGLAEAIEAVRRVVERYPDLSITVYGQQGQASAEVRIEREGGVVRATVVSVEGPDPTDDDGPGPGVVANTVSVLGFGDAGAVLPAEIPAPLAAPRTWPMAHEDPHGAAARLAEMIRQDPSLLATPDDR